MQIKSKVAMALGVAALVAPVAMAAPPDGKGGGRTKPAQYNVKGTYAGDGVVSVNKANGHARKAGWKGTDVAFDFSSAQIRVADANGDGTADLGDVVVGDRVKVKARLPKRDPGAGPYVAQRLVDESNRPGEADEGETPEEETPESEAPEEEGGV
jgi:hypothetical protein